jgi:hypothetical protein
MSGLRALCDSFVPASGKLRLLFNLFVMNRFLPQAGLEISMGHQE